LAAAALLMHLSERGPVWVALVMSGLAMALTSLGGFGVLFLRGGEERLPLLIDVGLGFSSGVMVAASFTSLLVPAIDSYGALRPLAGVVLGALTVHAVNELVPHEHLVKGYEGPPSGLRKLKAAWLVALAIIIHNLPEGLSIGAASAYSARTGFTVGLAIAIQDIPEGLAVSVPVYASGGSLGRALLYAWLSGLSEMAMAVPAAYLTEVSVRLLPYALGFGAGAMLYVVSHEAIPETHRSGHEGKATLAFFAGLILMAALDTAIK